MGSLRALALALVLVPAVASAQSAKDKQKASDLVKQAIAKSQAGDHETAVQLYEDAYKIIPSTLLLSNIGSEYQAMKKPVEALKYFCKYIEADPTGSNISFATAQAKTLYIELGGVPNIEDKDVCKPIVKPPAPKVEPDPHVVDAPPSQPEPTPGAGDAATRKRSTLRLVGIGVGALGAGVFGLGVYYGFKAKGISDDITNHDPNDPWPANIKQLEADGASFEKKQIGFMIGGGLALVGGAALFVLGGSKSSGETGASVTVSPVATPDQLGVAASGRF